MVLYIYGLHADDDNTIMYVGCSKNPAARLSQHICFARGGFRERPNAWIRSVIARGGNVVFSILEECSIDTASHIEESWIKRIRTQNPDLTNAAKYVYYRRRKA